MSDNITVEGFYSLFNYTMAEILQDTYDLLAWIFIGLAIFLIFGLWLDNRKKMQSLQDKSRILRTEVECSKREQLF